MKNIKYLSLVFLLPSCATSNKNYEGYIFDNQKKPINNIRVCEEYTTNCINTDNNGFFKLQKNSTSIRDLIIFYNNKPIDTMKTVWSQHGEKINYSYIEGRKDTLFIDIK